MKRQCVTAITLIVSLLIFYFLILPILDFNQLVDSLKNTDLILFSLALLFILLSNVIASLRWSILLQQVNAKYSQRFFNSLSMFCVGQIAGLVVPSRVGNYTKVPLVKKLDNLSYEAILAAVNAETILDLFYISCAGIVSMLILSTMISNYTSSSVILIMLIFLILIGSLAILVNIHRVQSIGEEMSLSESNWFVRTGSNFLGKCLNLLQSTRNILSKKIVVIKSFSLTLASQFFWILGLFIIIESVHTSLPLVIVFAILSLTVIIGIASLIPGGFGASDLTLIALLGFEGIPIPVATNIMILWRFGMYLPTLLVVGIYFIQKKLD
jgi:uncharacterized protein (TIRG00374 family)